MVNSSLAVRWQECKFSGIFGVRDPTWLMTDLNEKNCFGHQRKLFYILKQVSIENLYSQELVIKMQNGRHNQLNRILRINETGYRYFHTQ